MIIFDRMKLLHEIKKNGIGATDKNANYKLRLYMENLVNSTSYRKGKIIDKAKDIATEYFYGLPDELVQRELETMYENIKSQGSTADLENEWKSKNITLYQSEMMQINSLGNYRLKKLAFAALVLHKFCSQTVIGGENKNYKYVKVDEAAIYKMAELDDISGTKKHELWKSLSDSGFISFSIKENTAYKFHPDWVAMLIYTIPCNVDLKPDKDGEEVFMRVTNYDDVLLYLRYWLHDDTVTLCEDCGCPIEKTSNAKRLCSWCATKRKMCSDKTRYYNKIGEAIDDHLIPVPILGKYGDSRPLLFV